MTDDRHAEITHRLSELQKFLAGFQPTKLPLTPYPSDLRELNNDLELIAEKVDAVVRAYGDYLNAHTHLKIDLSDFHKQLWGALDGNATHHIEGAAADLQQEMLEAVS